jgi:hypothetical protein
VVNAGGLVDVCALALTARASRPMVAANRIVVVSFFMVFFGVDGLVVGCGAFFQPSHVLLAPVLRQELRGASRAFAP